MHIDDNEFQFILIYKYFRHDLLALIEEHPDFPAAGIKKILDSVAKAINEFRDKDWIHIDIKPNNIFVDWTRDNQGIQTVQDVALGDFDIAFKSENRLALRTRIAIGDMFWRSPEGQTATGVTKASDIFSFGLVCLSALGASELPPPKNIQPFLTKNPKPEPEVLCRHFIYFDPLSKGLLQQFDDNWRDALRNIAAEAESIGVTEPEMRFQSWRETTYFSSEAKSMIPGMINLDPGARPTIDEVLRHQWWISNETQTERTG
ncbi:hypothetical protein WAI453_002380 [Rhynchosporium graminicola]|uniref:Protein kinase domain-containing protein n=1 Tax=Rhynchosporium graminicola TaxID=2792576 RepID=A0A1E1KNV4_9HELO|nr:uncharacterized protein RCO7_07963 [Rhynchosporium commune]